MIGVLALVGASLSMVLPTLASGPPASAATPGWTVYVGNVNSNTVTPIDTATNTAGTPIPVGSQPEAIAISPNGATVYVANNGDGTVTPINTVTNSPGAPITVGIEPMAIAISPNGATVYVANSASNTVTPIDTATNTPGTAIPVGDDPEGIAFTPDGTRAYVANVGANSVTPIDVATNTPGTAIPVGTNPEGIAITPNGKTLYVGNFGSNNVTPINVATNTASTPVPVGYGPYQVAISPDGKTVYAANFYSNTVTPIATATNTAGSAISAGSGPFGIAVTPDGATVYVADGDGNDVTPIGTATGSAGDPIAVGQVPLPLAISPDQAPAAHLSVTAEPAGTPTAFDASASTVAYGSIASYTWSFGDGTTATTASPTTTHTYTAPGTYNASVTETSSGGTSTSQVFTGQTMTRSGGPQAVASASVDVSTSTSNTPTVSVTANAPSAGNTLTFTATVTGTGAAAPSGPVDWTISGPASACSATSGPIASGNVSTYACSIDSAAAGTYDATASFQGDSQYAQAQGSDQATVTSAPPTVPGAPTLTLATAGNNQVVLTWTAPTNNGGATINSYNILRATMSGAETVLQSGVSGTTYTDFTAVNGTTYYYEIEAVNSAGTGPASNELPATPAPPGLAITTTSLSSAAAGRSYSATLAAKGGTTPYAWSLSSGSLPAGLSLTGSGTISGVPTTPGTYTFTVEVIDSSVPQLTTSGPLSLTVTTPPYTAPAFISAARGTSTDGASYSAAVRTTGWPLPSLTASGLPAWLSFVDNGNGTGTLTGTPPAGTGGIFKVTIVASNTNSATGVTKTASQTYSLTVDEPPTITGVTPASPGLAKVGTAFTATVKTTGYPAASLTQSGAPPGFTFTDKGNGTGTLTGTATGSETGSYTIVFTASNATGPVKQTYTLNVDSVPAITSASSATATVGSAFNFQVSASGAPAPSLSESGALPKGLTFVDNGNGTATISGVPATGTAKIYTLTLKGVNPAGTGTQTFTLTVH